MTELQVPLNSFAQYQITKYEKETASLRSKGKKVPEPYHYITVSGLYLARIKKLLKIRI